MAAIAGVDPFRHTYREIVIMHEAVSRNQWDHTAEVLSLIANVNRDPDKHDPFTLADFHAWRRGDQLAEVDTQQQLAAEQMAAEINRLMKLPPEAISRYMDDRINEQHSRN